ncbi:DODA-type extradiol aromatic ring-opening family dioxygenase [Alkalinema pantanalense CENA528]|uniref:DODA-type extradiol aromatic ring-opening family dioxygenase n=1 Tax=Alkalinema pantanalense TaxID=1620705 RepID=UPI003D6EF44F
MNDSLAIPTTPQPLPTYFISHGGGPWPWMKDQIPGWAMLKASLQAMPQMIGTMPKAILVISGHWEESTLTLSSAAQPPMIYDYSGFPAHTYQVQYPAPGSPTLAEQVRELLSSAGFAVKLNPRRGFDHGTFVPLAVAYPEATIPVVQLSMQCDYDPAFHLAVGQAIAPLRQAGVLVIGSGLSYHNLRQLGPQAKQPSQQFDQWLTETLCTLRGRERHQRLIHWSQAPAARIAHPQEDHLVPLFVAVGAAIDELGDRVYHEDTFLGGIAVSSFRFG